MNGPHPRGRDRAIVRAEIRGSATARDYRRCMSRPRTFDERRVATAIRLPESVHRRLRQAATDRDISANLLVTRAVCEYLDRLPSADEVLAAHERSARKASR